MGRCRFVQPEVVRLRLSEDQWVDVKKHLTVGELRRAAAAVIGDVKSDGWRRPNLEMAGKSQVLAYLVDWSFTDAEDRRVPIDTDAQKLAAIDGLFPDDYRELEDVIERHAEAMAKARVEEKKLQSGNKTTSAVEAT